ncbi:MAG: exodeoxyribonuclease VII large subunit [Treponema sp.]|nr:MAG: exodeoxyribonuclease VII large subunit [Treponema sp.]
MVNVYTIKELTSQIKNILENNFGKITVNGEISNYRPASSGHLYFTLKDDKAAISAVMFKNRFAHLKFVPSDGMLVQVTGVLSVYEARGSYQIIVESMQAGGEGDILKMLELRKQKLYDEGLFDDENKKPLPVFPKSVAVITSPTGAAIRDFINVSTRRNSKITVNVLPAVVQGNDAAETLIKQLKIANTHNLGDVIVLTRGGGSLEDLLAFSDEKLVREIAKSKKTVVSAVGHEIDWALSDFVSDRRAPTPSAAAELVVPLLDDITFQIERQIEIIVNYIQNRLEKIKLMLAGFSAEALELKFRSIEQPFLIRLDDAKESILSGMNEIIQNLRHRIEIAKQILDIANPQSILDRGFSIVRKQTGGQTVRDASEVSVGEKLEIIPATGKLTAIVDTKQ